MDMKMVQPMLPKKAMRVTSTAGASASCGDHWLHRTAMLVPSPPLAFSPVLAGFENLSQVLACIIVNLSTVWRTGQYPANFHAFSRIREVD
jgi:hypothetical protein